MLGRKLVVEYPSLADSPLVWIKYNRCLLHFLVYVYSG